MDDEIVGNSFENEVLKVIVSRKLELVIVVIAVA